MKRSLCSLLNGLLAGALLYLLALNHTTLEGPDLRPPSNVDTHQDMREGDGRATQ